MSQARTPLVSVILPTLNRAALLRRSAGSVLNQSWRDLELIVVDDGSTEDIESAVRALADPRARCVRRDRGGVAAARNTGVQSARGQWLAFQDSDDEWLLDKLALQLAAAEGSPSCDAVVCALLRLAPGRARRYPAVGSDTLATEQVLRHPFAYTQTWLVRRQDVLDAGGFDESLRVWDDWDLLIRLSQGRRIRLLQEALVVSRISADGISRDHERFIHDIEKVLAKHLPALAERPRSAAHLDYVHGRLLGTAGHLREARGAFARALRRHPGHWRAAALLALSLGGPRLYRSALSRFRRPA